MEATVLSFLMKVALLAPPILLALTVHEAAHAWLAWRMGDPTARMLGRVSLNPLRHLDPTGTLVFFVTAWLGAGFGWAKPVPVNYRNIKNSRRAIMWISASGPLANLICAIVLALLLNLLISMGLFRGPSFANEFILNLFIFGIQINVVLAFFNLIPLPPLDGSGIVMGFLSAEWAWRYRQLGRYGFFILLGLILLPRFIPGFPNIIGMFVLKPAIAFMKLIMPF